MNLLQNSAETKVELEQINNGYKQIIHFLEAVLEN